MANKTPPAHPEWRADAPSGSAEARRCVKEYEKRHHSPSQHCGHLRRATHHDVVFRLTPVLRWRLWAAMDVAHLRSASLRSSPNRGALVAIPLSCCSITELSLCDRPDCTRAIRSMDLLLQEQGIHKKRDHTTTTWTLSLKAALSAKRQVHVRKEKNDWETSPSMAG